MSLPLYLVWMINLSRSVELNKTNEVFLPEPWEEGTAQVCC
jgi:hypothetical protein